MVVDWRMGSSTGRGAASLLNAGCGARREGHQEHNQGRGSYFIRDWFTSRSALYIIRNLRPSPPHSPPQYEQEIMNTDSNVKNQKLKDKN